MCAAVMSRFVWPAPALPGPPPPTLWPQAVSWASPVIVPSTVERSNSTQPQKPPRSLPQKDGLSQLNERPTCHVSWPDPPPYAPADAAKPPASAAAATSAARSSKVRRIETPLPSRLPLRYWRNRVVESIALRSTLGSPCCTPCSRRSGVPGGDAGG